MSVRLLPNNTYKFINLTIRRVNREGLRMQEPGANRCDNPLASFYGNFPTEHRTRPGRQSGKSAHIGSPLHHFNFVNFNCNESNFSMKSYQSGSNFDFRVCL